MSSSVSVARVRGIDHLDVSVSEEESLKSESPLFNSGVVLVVLGNPLHEFELSNVSDLSSGLRGKCSHLLLASHFIALEDTWGKSSSIGNKLASRRHGSAFTPGAEVVSITRSLVLVGTIALSRNSSSEKAGSDEGAHISFL